MRDFAPESPPRPGTTVDVDDFFDGSSGDDFADGFQWEVIELPSPLVGFAHVEPCAGFQLQYSEPLFDGFIVLDRGWVEVHVAFFELHHGRR